MEGISGGDRVRRAEARREREIDDRLQQEDTITNKDVAEAPASAPPTSTPRSRADSGIVEDGPIRQLEARGFDERQSSPTRRPADSTQTSDRRKLARSTPQVDGSWGPNAKRSRGLLAGTTRADYQASMRANRFSSFGPDHPPDDGDGDESIHDDLLILSAVLRGVDIMEIFSPPRVTEVCKKYSLELGESLDLKTGCDLSDRGEQRRARQLVRARAPYLIICSPSCTKLSHLQHLNEAINGPESPEKIEIELEQAKEHVRFCVGRMREQLAAGRHFLFEHPAWASSWSLPELHSLAETPGVLWQRADQCM